MTLPQHWPALCMAARLALPALPACDQRAYRDSIARGVVRFFPSRVMSVGELWSDNQTIWTEEHCIKTGDTRLSDAEAARLWATRPQ